MRIIKATFQKAKELGKDIDMDLLVPEVMKFAFVNSRTAKEYIKEAML